VVRNFEAIVSDGQLDECTLTLRELTQIRETLITSLTALYHPRIDYPGFNAPPAAEAATEAPADYEGLGLAAEKPPNGRPSGEVADKALHPGKPRP